MSSGACSQCRAWSSTPVNRNVTVPEGGCADTAGLYRPLRQPQGESADRCVCSPQDCGLMTLGVRNCVASRSGLSATPHSACGTFAMYFGSQSKVPRFCGYSRLNFVPVSLIRTPQAGGLLSPGSAGAWR